MEISSSEQRVGGLDVRLLMALTRANRSRIRQAIEEIKGSARGSAERSEAGGHSRSSGRIEISPEARFLAAASAEEVDRATRKLTMAELGAAYQDGFLETARRVEPATQSPTNDE